MWQKKKRKRKHKKSKNEVDQTSIPSDPPSLVLDPSTKVICPNSKQYPQGYSLALFTPGELWERSKDPIISKYSS